MPRSTKGVADFEETERRILAIAGCILAIVLGGGESVGGQEKRGIVSEASRWGLHAQKDGR